MNTNIPQISARLETYIVATVLSGVSSLTLATNTDKYGKTLSGLYGFVIDEGQTGEEFFIGTISAGVVSNIVSITDTANPQLTVSGLQNQHRKSASVKITDYPILAYLREMLNGNPNYTLDNILQFTAYIAPTLRQQVAMKGYVDDTLTGFTGTASNTTAGSIKTDQANNGLPRAKNVYVQQLSSSPAMNVTVLPINAYIDEKNIANAGGIFPSSGALLSPSLQVSINMPNNPANNDTWSLTVNGVSGLNGVFVTTIGATAGNVLIGVNAAATQANLLGLLQNPSTTNGTQVALTGLGPTFAGRFGFTSVGTSIVCQALNGQLINSVTGSTSTSGNSVTTNTNPRVDLVVIQAVDNTVQFRQGATAASPTVPTPNTGDVVLAEIYHRVGETAIKDNDDGVNGYIQKWHTPHLYRTDLYNSTNNPPILTGTTTGSANGYILTPSPAISSYFVGLKVAIITNFQNTGSATLNISGVNAGTIKKNGASNLASGDFASGMAALLEWDGNYWQLLSPVATPPLTAPVPNWVDEGTLTWAASSADQTFNIVNTGKSLYMVLFDFTSESGGSGTISLQVNGLTSGYSYTTLATGSLTNSTAQSSILLGSEPWCGELLIKGVSDGLNSRSIATSPMGLNSNGKLVSAQTTSDSGNLTSLKFLVSGTTVTGKVHIYSLAL